MEKDIQLNNMSIAILIYSLTGGGAERFISYLMPYLVERKISVTLVLMEENIMYPIPKEVNIYHLGKSKSNESGIIKLFNLPILAYKYAKLIKKLQISHSFSLLTRPNLINTLSKVFFSNNSKIVISERAYPSLQYGYNDLQSKINQLLISRLYCKANLIIGNSIGNSNDLVENFRVSKNQIITIPNPIDIKHINSIEPIENFFSKDFFNLITIGRLDAGKNHKMLIRSIANLPNVRLYIIGEGVVGEVELLKDLQHLIKELDLSKRVFMLGYKPNPFQYLKSANLFIFGSNHEGFPNVLLEAMACGLPILSTNCKSGPSEILQLKESKENDIMITDYGILTPINNERLMTKGINYFIQSPEYISKCKTRIKNRIVDFEKDNILEKYKNNILQ